jgi:hypothetical protein
MKIRIAIAAALAFVAAAHAAEPATERERAVVCVALPAEPAWQDFAYLAALSGSAALNDGMPIVLGVAADGSLRAEASDFLRRYRPERVLQIGAAPEEEREPKRELVAGDDADAVACELATRCFAHSARAVVCRSDDYPSALAAAVLSVRWRAPLLFSSESGLSARASETLGALGVRSACFVGARADANRLAPAVASVERLANAAEVARWMQKHALAIEYVAATAPIDRSAGQVRKLSLAAAALAAGRRGAVAPIEFTPSASDQPPPISARVELTERALADFRKPLGRAPETLCIVALPETIPMAPVVCADGIDVEPVTDLVYANLDDDPFVELAFGRFIAEDALSATLLAARSLAYEELVDPSWSRRATVAEWERESAPVFARAGFTPQLVEPAGAALETGSPFAEVAALAHSSHASWLGLGTTYAADSSALLAPCIVETGGCSAASLDQDPEGRSVAARLLRNGAVAFAGNTRRAVAHYELYRSEFWNAVLAGSSIGRAHRRALNCLVASMLDHGESEHGLQIGRAHV